MKRLQNRIAESSFTLPVVSMVAVVVWLLSGLIAYGWWPQFVCFVVCAYLIAEVNTSYALIRVRTRMMSCSFIMLSCAACVVFGSLQGCIVQLCFVAAVALLFHTYQDRQSPGFTFYAFLCLSLASMAAVQVLYLVPLLWLLMATHLLSLSWRSWMASLLGLATPYWFALVYVLYLGDFGLLAGHFIPLAQPSFPPDYSFLTIGHAGAYLLLACLMLTGMVHFWRNSFNDKIRTRQFFGFFIVVGVVVLVAIPLQPQLYDVLMPLAIVCTCPLQAHFITLTNTKITNAAFIAMSVVALLLTLLNLWMPLSLF